MADVNQAPDAQDDGFTTDELSLVTGNLFDDNGSGADSDPDGPALTIAAVNGNAADVGSQITLSSGALLTVNADGSFSYDPNGAFEYTPTFASGAYNTPSADTFSYTLAGGDSATVVLTINGVDNNDTVLGSEGDDLLTGGAGNDTMDGLDGNDLLRGRAGNDYIDGGDGFDRAGYYHVNEAAGGVTVDLNIVGAQDTGSQGWDTLVNIESVSGTPFADSLTGDDNDNWLWGSLATIDEGWISVSNNDYLDGQGGNDLLTVGIGDHTIIGGDGTDTLRFTENGWPEPGIFVQLFEQGSAQDTGAGTWTITGIENLSGGISDDDLEGDGNANVIAGDLGSDLLFGFGGADVLLGDGFINVDSDGTITTVLDQGTVGGNDSLIGGGGNDQLYGGGGNDSLSGGGGDDALYGGFGNDFLNAGFGNDSIDGGEGFDRVGYFGGSTSGITVDLRLQGSAQYVGEQGWDTLTNIEGVSGTVFGDTLTGDDNANWLWGSVSGGGTTNNDTLDGQGGDDLLQVGIGNHSLTGGSGIDTVSFTENGGAEPGINVSLALQGSAQDTGAGSWTLTDIENLSGGLGNDALTGDGGANVLAGYLGNDQLSGGAGNDVLYGDGFIATDNRPTGGSGPITTFADATDYDPAAIDGDDTLDGGAGNDQLYGGGGSDTASFASATGNVTALLYDGGFGEAFGAAGYDQLHDVENLSGSAFNDILYGNSLDNVVSGGDGHDDVRGFAGNDAIYGGGGDDLLYGNAGDDYIDGGDGYDRAGFFTGATAGVHVDLNYQGIAQDTGQGMDTLVNIENLSGTQFGDTLIGDEGDNVLWGSAATIGAFVSPDNNDTLIGNGGNDLLVAGIGNHSIDGGTGIDTFRFTENGVPETGITLSLLLAGEAQVTANGTWTLTGIENLSGSIAADNLTGDDGANVLAGDLGDDILSGGAGNDTLYGDGQIMWDGHGTGRSGPITTYADATGNYVGAVAGNDTLEGGAGDDQLYGGGGTDTASFASETGAVTALLYNSGFGEAYAADGYDQLHDIENLTGSAFNDTLIGNNQGNALAGGDGIDFLRGLGGNDALQGGAGDDYLDGGQGDDILDGGAGWDRLSYFGSATGPVTVDLRIQGVAQDTGQGMDTLIGIEHTGGTIYGDTLTGNEGDNWLRGSSDSAGSIDTLDGQGGNDLVSDGAGDHVLAGGTGIDTFAYETNGSTGISVSLALQGAAQDTGVGMMTLSGFENLSGNSGADTLTGDGGNNVLAGGEGNDTLVGGAGNDSLYGDGTIGLDTQGTGLSGPISLFPDVVSIGGADGDDVLEGGLGDDLLNGGGGTDTATYEHASGAVQVDLGSGQSSGADGNDSLVGIENVTGSAFDDDLTGDGGSNILDGRSGNDFISGAAGNDTIYGGDGDDFLQGDFSDNNITAIGNDVIYGGAGNDILRGGMGDDQLIGGTGNDLLRGNGGVDYFDGGADDGLGVNGIGDRVSFYDRRATQGVVADLRTGIISNDGFGNVETMVGIESLGAGTAFADTFYGNDAANFLTADVGDQSYGFGGDDVFQLTSAPAIVDGGTGVDKLNLYVDSGVLAPDSNADGLAELRAAATAGFIVNLGAGTITDGYGFSGTVAGIENVDGTILADTLIGDAAANVLNGNEGDDTLEGGLGNDALDGGAGTDTASYAHASGGVTVALGAGTASGADGNDTLANIENVTGSAFNDALTGNGLANVLTGGDGHDTLRGNGGDDTLYGGAGDELLYGNAGNDYIDGGDGYDRAGYFSGATAGVTVDLRIVGAQNTGQGMDTLVNVEAVTGTEFSDTLIGDDGNNWLGGQSDGAADTISGNGGNDFITDGLGNHVLDGGTGVDVYAWNSIQTIGGLTVSLAQQGVAQNTGAGSVTLTNFESLSGSTFNDSLTGDGNANVLAGDLGDDALSGGGGNDSLYGDGSYKIDSHGTGGSGPITFYSDETGPYIGVVGGNDTLEGGLGNDLLNGGGGTDTASYAHASGGVTVNLGSGTATGADGSDTLVSIENVIGGAFNDVLIGNNSGNLLDGGDGHDSLSGTGGNDTLLGGNGNDSLGGGGGDDLLDGGAGFDRVNYNDGLTGVTVNLNMQGSAQNTGRGNDTLIGIENVVGSISNDVITGDSNDNWLWGGTNGSGVTGNDTIDGGAGNDLIEVGAGTHTLTGGTGNDTLTFWAGGTDVTSAGVAFSLANTSAQDTRQGMMTATGFENLSGSKYNDALTGDSASNIIAGNLGDDQLSGGDGNDFLYGDGQYTVFTQGGLATGPIRFLADGTTEFGGVPGNDTLEGGLGNDLLDGGVGTDTATYVNASGAVTASLLAGTSSGADGIDTYVSIENLTGGAFNDTLTGDNGNNQLDGGGGADFLVGGLGNDTIIGGAGIDRAGYYQTNSALGGVTVSLIAGTATGAGQGSDTLSGVENVSGTAFADVLTGDNGNNWLWGSAATYQSGASTVVSTTNNDSLDGGAGNDLLTVGKGNHTLTGGTGNDTIQFTENGAAENNLTVSLATLTAQNTGNGTWTISGVENLSGGIGNDTLTGDNANNVLAGDRGADILNGGIGNDTLYGDGVIKVDANGVITIYGDGATVAGIDNLSGGDGDDFLYGGGGNDILKGDRDNDTLYGGTGNDTMTGGQGNDRYVIEANSGADTISGFAQAADKIVFDASSGVTSFSQLTLTLTGGTNTLVSWGNGNSIMITGVKAKDMLASDFQFVSGAAGYEHAPHDFTTGYTTPHDVFL